jgi:hypothetical protein
MKHMRKNILLMMAAILTCGFTVTWLSACSSGDDDKTETPQEQADVQMTYAVEVTDDVLKVANVEVNYVDQTGAKQKEVMTSTTWKKTLNAKVLPLTEGLWAKLTPKGTVEPDSSYIVKVTTSATYEAKLANGQTASGGFGTDPTASVSLVQTPEHVAAWCATSPTIGFAVDKNGNATKTSVDFGGNSSDDGNVVNVSPDAQQDPPALDFTDPVFGQVIGSDGKNYDYDKLPAGVTPEAKICYVYNHLIVGYTYVIALALTDEYFYNWNWGEMSFYSEGSYADCIAEDHEPKFSNCNWRLPELGMFYTMIDAAGGYEQLRDGFESVGGENMVRDRYWVTDSFKEGTVVYYKVYDFGKGREGYAHLWTFYERVRACLVYIY